MCMSLLPTSAPPQKKINKNTYNVTELRMILFGSSSSLTVRQLGKSFIVYKSNVVPQYACHACNYSPVCNVRNKEENTDKIQTHHHQRKYRMISA